MPLPCAAATPAVMPRMMGSARATSTGPFGDQRAQALADHELEDEEERAVGELAEVGRGSNVRVVDGAREDRLTLEPRHHLRLPEQLAVKHLQREELAHVRVLDAVDDPHAALAESFHDPIAICDQGVGR